MFPRLSALKSAWPMDRESARFRLSRLSQLDNGFLADNSSEDPTEPTTTVGLVVFGGPGRPRYAGEHRSSMQDVQWAEECPAGILHGSGDTAANRRFLAQARLAFPEREYAALIAWISTFYGFQQNWLLDASRFSALLKCRQIGASHTYAAATVLWALLGEDTSIVSVGERESTEVLRKVAKHAEALTALGSEWATPKATSATRVALQAGGVIMALPSTSGGRGQSGNVVLDEAAYYEHASNVWDGASGTVLHGYRMRVASTPNGIGNLFHQLFTGPTGEGYRKHSVSLEQAIADGLRVDVDACWKMARNDPRVFDQLFNCKFLDGQLQYLPTDAINECSVDDLYTFEGDYYAGLDIGKTVDRTVLIVVRKVASGLRLVQHVASCKRTDSDELDRIVANAFRRFNLKRLCVDATGIGAYPVERMQKRHGKMRVEPVNFTLQSKEELATCLYTSFTEGTVRIPKTDEAVEGLAHGTAVAIRNDLCAIRREVTAAGNIRYDAPHTDEGHADSAWALALALHACSGPDRKRHEVVPLGEQELRLS